MMLRPSRSRPAAHLLMVAFGLCFVAPSAAGEGEMDYEHNSVVSRVGPVTSFVYSFESTSGAHPTSGCHLYSEYRGDPADSTL